MIEESVYEAEKAVQQSSSSFIAMEVKEHVTLLPSYLGRVGTGVTEELASRILHYHAVYGGVLMAFDRIRVLHRTGHIYDELPHIHINIEYSATIFRPQAGNVMCGEVNKVGVDHIGCLLFGCFNTAVTCSPLDHLTKEQEEKRLKSWCSRAFETGERIWFSVSRIEVTGNLLSLRGDYLIEEEEEGKAENDVEKLETKKEKKKKKRKQKQEKDEEDSERKEKKGKRKREVEGEEGGGGEKGEKRKRRKKARLKRREIEL